MDNNEKNARNRDAGLALVLILLLTAWFSNNSLLLPPAIILLVTAMSLSVVFKPFAMIWFALSALLGTISSKLILTLIFFLIVLPVGLIRQMTGADPLQLRNRHLKKESAFKKTKHTYQKKDLSHPY